MMPSQKHKTKVLPVGDSEEQRKQAKTADHDGPPFFGEILCLLDPSTPLGMTKMEAISHHLAP